MAALLSLFASLGWGVSDFLGARATAKIDARLAFLAMVGIEAVLYLPVCVVWGGSMSAGAMWWSIVGGATGAVGMLLYLQGMAHGRTGVVVPLAGAISAALPVIVDLAAGAQFNGLIAAGLVFGVLAIPALAYDENPDARGGPTTRTAYSVALGLSAGAIFGLFFISVNQASESSTGLWPALVSALASAAITAVAGVRLLPHIGVIKPHLKTLVAAGGLYAVATPAFLIANRRGSLALVSVIGSLYPAVTVILAVAVLKERILRAQALGLAAAALSVVFLTAG